MSEKPVAVYDFTASCDKVGLEELICVLDDCSKKWIFQKEKGMETGFEHYQGKLSLKKKDRRSSVIKKWPALCRISPTVTENMGNEFYVTKEETRIDGPWSDRERINKSYVPRQIREINELWDWQQQIVDDANVWNTRNINIVVDRHGGNGKSILKTYVGVHKIGRNLPFVNDYKDIMRMVMDTPKVRLYIVDMPRAISKEKLYQFFSGMETLKDGYAYDDRYEFREEYFDCPNIWIFTNSVPDLNLLSKDRWILWELNNGKLSKWNEIPQIGTPLLKQSR